jgi:glycerol kinase
MLMNIDTLKWDSLLCKFFGIPQHILPEIRSSAEIYGTVSNPQVLAGIPISGVSTYMGYTD